ncbi:MAG: ABC transporter ATP-binding protein [Desulfobacterales bacterium]|nr:ABC transporter ATP-binding protein [Desulfobacterales bacterium]
MINDNILEINDVFFGYNRQVVLENINLTIREFDFVAMIGPNGGGKTTLLKLILGLLKPHKGTIRVFGSPAQKASHFIGYVPQNIHINVNFPITALDVVCMGKLGPEKKNSRNMDRDDALTILEKLSMSAYANRKMGELSGGQRQRVFIARALISNPKLLLLDEPTASIDSKGQSEFYDLLKQLNQELTIIVVSHDLLVISSHVKSVACLNRRLFYHAQSEITSCMFDSMYPNSECCPVEMVAHGLPHRVLQNHHKIENE